MMYFRPRTKVFLQDIKAIFTGQQRRYIPQVVVYVIQLHWIQRKAGVVCDRPQFTVHNAPHDSVHMYVGFKLNLEGEVLGSGLRLGLGAQ